MAVTYTTVALVRATFKDIHPDITDPDIEEWILQAEGLIDTVMLQSFKTIFDEDKHQIIRQCCTDLAAFYALRYDPANFDLLETAEITINMLWNSADRSLFMLSRKRVVEFLEHL